MKCCNRSQTNQGKVLDDGCYVISTLMAFISKVMLLQLPFFLNANSAKHKICWRGTLEGI